MINFIKCSRRAWSSILLAYGQCVRNWGTSQNTGSPDSDIWAGSSVYWILLRHEWLLLFHQGHFWRLWLQRLGVLPASRFCTEVYVQGMLAQQTPDVVNRKDPWGCSQGVLQHPWQNGKCHSWQGCFSPVQQSPIWKSTFQPEKYLST